MPDTVFRDSSVPESKRALVRLSREVADEPAGGALWRTLLSFREVRSSTLLVSGVLVMPYSSGVTIRDGTEAGGFTSPLKLFEYMTAGKPIVAIGVPPVLKVLRPGENSLVVPPDDASKV